jgi:hypothetical protein
MAQGGDLTLSFIAPKLAGEQEADREFICGRSGSGKSYASRQLLSLYGPQVSDPRFRGHVVIVDPNGNFRYPANRTVDDWKDVRPGKDAPVTLYRPSPYRQKAEDWNSLFEKLFHFDGRLLVYIDELYALEPLFSIRRLDSGVNWFNAYLTRGRALGKGAILVAQRPVNIPRNVIAQANYFMMFDLPVEEDRAVMAGTIGRRSDTGEDVRERDVLKKYEFWFAGPNTRYPVRMRLSG